MPQHLTDENFATLKGFVFRQRQTCEVCGGKEFVFGRQLLFAPAMEQPGTPGIAAGLPLVSVTCELCGHTRFFSAAIVGVRTPWDKAQQAD